MISFRFNFRALDADQRPATIDIFHSIFLLGTAQNLCLRLQNCPAEYFVIQCFKYQKILCNLIYFDMCYIKRAELIHTNISALILESYCHIVYSYIGTQIIFWYLLLKVDLHEAFFHFYLWRFLSPLGAGRFDFNLSFCISQKVFIFYNSLNATD